MNRIIVAVIFLIICAVFLILATFIFYHIGRYSLIGDASKRSYVIYAGSMIMVVLIAAALIVVNHLLT